MKIVVTGATGFIGREVVIALAKAGHECLMLVRHPEAASCLPGKAFRWDGLSSTPSEDLKKFIEGSDVVVHLAGEPVAEGRWTEKRKTSIWNSRVIGTRNLVKLLAELPVNKRPRTLISGSAIGFYGHRGDEEVSETSPAGEGFLADVVKDWEDAAETAESLGLRVVKIRTGIVLGSGGGALEKMQPVTLGSGNQWMSWIHLHDVVGCILFCIAQEKCRGAYNLVSPQPVQNREFTLSFAEARKTAALVRVPELALKTLLGEMSQILLDSQKVSSKRIQAEGYTFLYTRLDQALKDIYENCDARDKKFSVTQFIPKPVDEVFAFFCKAENLESITPPWLNFKIIKKSTEEVQEGSLIDYELKVHGFPVSWRTRIESWKPPSSFVDTQVKGPYSKWHHTHTFEAVSGGTIMRDDVVYRLPVGALGSMLGGSIVSRDVREIFAYRRKKILDAFAA